MAEQNGTRIEGVRLTSPDRILWPEMGLTKRDLAEYYQAVAGVMLPRVRDRPLTLLRCPAGTGDTCFYQKHARDTVPGVVPRVEVQEKDGPATYLYVNGTRSLIGLTQIGVLELHVWGSRRDRLERPDRLVFDLDPDESLPFSRVTRAALELRDRLDGLGLTSFAKTTGGKGLHVVAPIDRRSDWDEARRFARGLAEAMEADDPSSYTTANRKADREGKVFLDYLRNAANATAIAEYSPRARDGAPVAVPLVWEEVKPQAKEPPRFGPEDVLERLADHGDPWDGFDSVRQSITRAMKAELGLD